VALPTDMGTGMAELSLAWIESRHFVRKLCRTLRLVATMTLARTFGRYVHSVWDGRMDYAVYQWRGRLWAIPTSPLSVD
jgi:hypothetical protein